MHLVIVGAGWMFLAWSVLTLVRTPLGRLWKAGVAATEWGHWLGWAAGGLVLAGAALDEPLRVLAPSLVAALLFETPVLRALARSRPLAVEIDRVFPRSVAGEAGEDGRQRRAPLLLRDLPHIPLPRVRGEFHVYRETGGLGLGLDLYRPPFPGPPAPLVVVVHGGSWMSGDSAQLAGLNRYLAGCGYAVAALNYRLAPRFRFPAPLEDIRAALEFLGTRAEDLGVDRGRTVLLGRSAGGHLSLLAAYGDTCPVRGVAAFYAPTDLIWSWRRPAPKRLMDSNAVIASFLGGGPGEVPDLFEEASPIRWVRKGVPPTLLVHGGNDEMVSPVQSRRLAAELTRAGVPHFHLELPWGKHGVDANLAGPGGQIVLFTLERFLAFATR